MKYQIFGPNGNKVCIVLADEVYYSDELRRSKFSIRNETGLHTYTIPGTWAAIPLESIVKDEPKEIEEIVKENVKKTEAVSSDRFIASGDEMNINGDIFKLVDLPESPFMRTVNSDHYIAHFSIVFEFVRHESEWGDLD